MALARSDSSAQVLAVPEAATSLAQWFARRLRRAMLVMVVLCTVIALLLGSLFHSDHVVAHFVYSYAIGFSCWLCSDGTRLLLALVVQRRRLAQGLPLAHTGIFTGWRLLLPMVLLGTLVGLPLGMSIGDLILGMQSPSLFDLQSPSTRVTLAVTVTAALFVLFAMSTLERLAVVRIQAEQARAQASELELKLLQSQLEPHMLFNTLANLRVLIGLEPARAQLMLDHLIAFLRATLNASRVQFHPLSTEFARIGEYLSLMAFRMGPRLEVQTELPPELAQASVPPLILQPLVENAIRHGLEPKVGAARLRVAARLEGHTLVLSVRDKGVGLSAAAAAAAHAAPGTGGTHFGLQQVRARLATLYGEQAGLSLQEAEDGDGGTLATVRLPFSSSSPSPA